MSVQLVFEWVIRSSIMASILVVFLLLFKFVIKDRLGPKWHYYIWLLVLLRLLVPAAPPSAFSVYNLFTNIEQEAAPIIVSVDNTQEPRTRFSGEQGELQGFPRDGIAFRENESVQDGFTPIQPQESPTPDINTSGILPYIWLAGLLIIALYTIAVNLLFWLKVKNQGSISDQRILRLFDKCKSEMGLSRNIPLIEIASVNTTTLFGFIKPKLLLPLDITKKLTPEELRYIFFHELAHIKQKDIMINWWVALAQIIHWFNPIIWYAFYGMRQDREVACDALALSYLNPEDYKKYGQVIIRLLERFAEQKQVPGMIGVAGDNSNIKKRVTMISLFKKNSYKMSVAAVAIMILFTAVFLTNASPPLAADHGLVEETEDEVVDKQGEIRGNTTGNIANGGYVAYQDGWIYYSNLEDERKLYKKRTDGSDLTLLSSNSATNINVVGDWVYYSNPYYYPTGAPMGGNVYKIKTDGSDETRLNDHNSFSVQVVDDWIYYISSEQEGQKLIPYKMKIDGSEQTIIIDRTVHNLNVVDGWVYFIERVGYNDMPRIYRVRTDGSDLTLLLEEQANSLIVEGEWMYYNQWENYLIRVKTDGSSRQIVNFEPTNFINFNVDGDWIYYINIDEGVWGNIYRIRNDGGDCERVNKERALKIFAAGDWIYYLGEGSYGKISKDVPKNFSNTERSAFETTETEVESSLYEVMMQDINGGFLKGYNPVSLDEAVELLKKDLIVPGFLPERFTFLGVFASHNPDSLPDTSVILLWYDPDNLEYIEISQRLNHVTFKNPNYRSPYVTTRKLESDIDYWYNYTVSFDASFVQDGVEIYGTILTYRDDNFDECVKILESLL